ncbi:hypothetical protein H9P43_009184 [Blastocladiella emersonii ATCC 22665]|nr:hypothetical protein H9P43_009184 [Blastocladiella emersonii ATCC 22665]
MCIFSATKSMEQLESPPYSCPLCHNGSSVILTRTTTTNTLCYCITVSTKVGTPVYRCQAPGCHWAGPAQPGDAAAAAAAGSGTKQSNTATAV